MLMFSTATAAPQKQTSSLNEIDVINVLEAHVDVFDRHRGPAKTPNRLDEVDAIIGG